MKVPRRTISRLLLTIWRGESSSLFMSCISLMELHLDVEDVGGHSCNNLAVHLTELDGLLWHKVLGSVLFICASLVVL